MMPGPGISLSITSAFPGPSGITRKMSSLGNSNVGLTVRSLKRTSGLKLSWEATLIKANLEFYRFVCVCVYFVAMTSSY